MADFTITNYIYGNEKCDRYISSLDLSKQIPDKNTTNEILFTSVSDSHDSGRYVVKAFGIYPNGRQKLVYITGIKPFVEIEVLNNDDDVFSEIEKFASSSTSGFNGSGSRPTLTRVKGKYLVGINPETTWYRYSFDTLWARNKFIKLIQPLYEKGKIRKSNDKKKDYYVIAAQQYGFSLSMWNYLLSKPERTENESIYFDVSKIKQSESPSREASLYKNTSITWDIETYHYDYKNRSDGVPVPEDNNCAISCISVVVKQGRNITSLTTLSVYGRIGETKRNVSEEVNFKELKTRLTVNNHIYCNDEEDLLLCFFDIITAVKPDIMIAFNDFDYDWKWIIKRTLYHNIKSQAFYALSGDISKDNRKLIANWWETEKLVEEEADDNDGSDYEEVMDDDNDESDDENELEQKPKPAAVKTEPKDFGFISSQTKRLIKLEANESMVCVFPNAFCRMIFIDTRVLLRKANPKIDTSSLNYYLEANGLGKKNDMDHSVAQELTAEVYRKNQTRRPIVFDFDKYKDDLEAIGIKDYKNVDEILTIMLNYCLVDSIKTSILLDKSEEVLSKRMLAGVSHVSLTHAFYSGVSIQITNILSEYCDLPQFRLKYSTDPPLDKDTSGKKYAGALVLAPKIMGSFTPLNMREKYEEQVYYDKIGIEETTLDLKMKVKAQEKSSRKTQDVEYIVNSINLTDFKKPLNLKDIVSKDISEEYFVSIKAIADSFINCDYKVNGLNFYSSEFRRSREKLGDTFKDNDYIPPEENMGDYGWVDDILKPLGCDEAIEPIKNLYRKYVYINTTLNDYYSLETKDVPAGELFWKPRFPSMKVDYNTIDVGLCRVVRRYERAKIFIMDRIKDKLKEAGFSSKQIKYFMEPSGLATTALDFSSLYPSIIEEFNLSIDKMIISSGDPELYAKYKDDPNYKTIYCFYGGDEPRTAHCLNHNNDVNNYGVYAYILKRLKVIRTEIRKELAEIEEKNKPLLVGLGRKKPDDSEKHLVLKRDEYTDDEWREKEEQCDFYTNQEGVLNSKQLAVKVVMNSFYGSTGNKNSQARCIEMSAGITAEGVKHLKLARDVIEELGVTIRYGDTDSLYFSRPVMTSKSDLLDFYYEKIDGLEYNKRDVKAAIGFAANAQTLINNTIKRKNNNAGIMKMAYEEALKPFFNLNKKRYFGLVHLDPDNVSFDISDKSHFFKKRMFTRGMDFKKRSSIPIGIEIINNMLYFLLDQGNQRKVLPNGDVVFSNVVTLIKKEIRRVMEMSNTNREELFAMFAKKVAIKKRPNITVASIRERLPNYELVIGSSVKVVIIKDKLPPVTAKGKKAGVQKTHRSYPLDYAIKQADFDLDIAGYLEGQFTTQLSDLISYMFQPFVSKYITEYNDLKTRNTIAINDMDERIRILKNLSISGLKQFISGVSREDNVHTGFQLAEYDKFSKTIYKTLKESASYKKIVLYKHNDFRFPLYILQGCLGDGRSVYYNKAGQVLSKASRDKTEHPNFKTRGNRKKLECITDINKSNRRWLADLFLELWTLDKSIKEIDIPSLIDYFENTKIPFLERLDELKEIDKKADAIILENRTSIEEFLERSDEREELVRESIKNIVVAICDSDLNTKIITDIVIFFDKYIKLKK